MSVIQILELCGVALLLVFAWLLLKLTVVFLREWFRSS